MLDVHARFAPDCVTCHGDQAMPPRSDINTMRPARVYFEHHVVLGASVGRENPFSVFAQGITPIFGRRGVGSSEASSGVSKVFYVA